MIITAGRNKINNLILLQTLSLLPLKKQGPRVNPQPRDTTNFSMHTIACCSVLFRRLRDTIILRELTGKALLFVLSSRSR